MASTWAACDTSVWIHSASPPASRISRTASSPVSRVRLAIATHAPSRANARAVARPMPVLPPVTKAILPDICVVMDASCVCSLAKA